MKAAPVASKNEGLRCDSDALDRETTSGRLSRSSLSGITGYGRLIAAISG
jgi:hypothetical protein